MFIEGLKMVRRRNKVKVRVRVVLAVTTPRMGAFYRDANAPRIVKAIQEYMPMAAKKVIQFITETHLC